MWGEREDKFLEAKAKCTKVHSFNYICDNEIWRTKNAKFRSGELIEEEMVFKNFGKVKYEPKEYEIEK